MRLHCAASPPGAPLIDQGVKIDCPLGDACKIGSTPDNSVIATTPVELPELSDVATIITASPFCKSAKFDAGILEIACCKSPPCPPAPVPPRAPPAPRCPPASPLFCSSAEPPAAGRAPPFPAPPE